MLHAFSMLKPGYQPEPAGNQEGYLYCSISKLLFRHAEDKESSAGEHFHHGYRETLVFRKTPINHGIASTKGTFVQDCGGHNDLDAHARIFNHLHDLALVDRSPLNACRRAR
jgi:hypothetical protein